MTDNKAFRDYATRVSFNLTLSRNQIAQLRSLLIDIEFEKSMSWQQRKDLQHELRGGEVDRFVVSNRSLLGMGLIVNDPRWIEDRDRSEAARAKGEQYITQYLGPGYQLTEAGEHVVSLLRLAGLIQPAAVNSNRRKGARVA